MSLRTGVWLGLAIVAGCAAGCAPLSTADRPGQPAGWDDGVRATAAEDLNPDPNIVEVALDARPAQMSFVPGGATTVFTYDGLMPGPLIRARVGNRVIVHFTNSLPEATTIHWHGLRIPAAMDGMPDLSQPPVQPGAASTMTSSCRTPPRSGTTRTSIRRCRRGTA